MLQSLIRSEWKLLGETVEAACYPRPRWFIAESFASMHVHRRYTLLFFPRFSSSIEEIWITIVKKLLAYQKKNLHHRTLTFRLLYPRIIYDINQLTTIWNIKEHVRVVFSLRLGKIECDLRGRCDFESRGIPSINVCFPRLMNY